MGRLSVSNSFVVLNYYKQVTSAHLIRKSSGGLVLKLKPVTQFHSSTKLLTDKAQEPAQLNNNPETLVHSEVQTYWADLLTFQNEPGQAHFKDFSSMGHVIDKDMVLGLLKKLILSETGQGDLVPSIAAKNCCQLYESLDMAGRRQFIHLLINEFGTSTPQVAEAAQAYLEGVGPSFQVAQQQQALSRLETILRHSLIPLHHRFFERVYQLPNGMRFLVDLRLDGFKLQRERFDPAVAALLDSLTFKLQGWLHAFLDLERITWKSSAVTLEKCMAYEQVHPFRGWDDLKQRVGPGRRCYGFFHRSMALDPLVYVQVALVTSIADNVQTILNQSKPGFKDTKLIRSAIFYSINTQAGLKGVDLGSFLIKRVVSELQMEFPHIETFCTLSPIPKLRRWVFDLLAPSKRNELSDIDSADFLSLGEKAELDRLAESSVYSLDKPLDTYTFLLRVLSTDAWLKDPPSVKVLRPILLRLAVKYILTAKVDAGNVPFDPVAHFHLRNGACVHRLNWLADTSEKGLRQSFGLMINYNYLLEHIEQNNLAYLRQGKIAISAPPDSPLFAPYTLSSLASQYTFHDTYEPYSTI